MKVLFIVDHAPDYREAFFQSLAKHCNLTVLSHPCKPDGLTPPESRNGYNYIEMPLRDIGPFRYIKSSIPVSLDSFDVLCIDFNPRQIWRSVLFLKNKEYWNKWIWWGHVYGRSSNKILEWFRRFILEKAQLVLVYSRKISNELKKELPDTPIVSFNNSQSFKSDFIDLQFPKDDQPHFIFVGRPQPRKRLDRILKIAKEYPSTQWRLIGPGMKEYMLKNYGDVPKNIQCFGKTTGEDLIPHFEWCHAVVNPGHLGLLISNAAIHGRPVIIQKNTKHAPEVALAHESNQIFIDFDNKEDVERIVSMASGHANTLKEAAKRLKNIAISDYTFENMVEKHMYSFNQVFYKKI